jgi:uncharacterized membrane protein
MRRHPIAARRPSFLRLDAHHRFIVAAVLAVVTYLGLQGRITFAGQLIAAWNVFTLATIVLAWIVMTTRDPYEVRRQAGQQDASATFLFSVVVTAATISLVAVFLLLGSAKNLSHGLLAIHVGLSMSAIVLSWALVHTLFALRYAHIYYRDAHKVTRDRIEGGLLFPGTSDPDYLDFAYFAVVIGMTCQVSDVQIASKGLRRLAIVHGLISFAFNTAILAMFVNILAGLI